jgi:Polyketide cyclase / dehydrase and lipid transport
MKFESSTLIDAPASRIFAIYANVADWPRWDPDAKAASIDGPFETGATGVVVPHGGPKSKIIFSRVIRDQGFVVDCRLPLCAMRFDYSLEPQRAGEGGATRVTHAVSFEGLLSPIFGRLIGSGMKKTMPRALARLKALAESTQA